MAREGSARLLALLGLLQSRPVWTGCELAERLDVSTRTVRNDIDRLPARLSGGCRTRSGRPLPARRRGEAAAAAARRGGGGDHVGLAAATGITGIEETSARALAKVKAILPYRLRRQVDALRSAVTAGPEKTESNVSDPGIDVGLLTAIAAAIRDQEEIRFDYRDEERRAAGPRRRHPDPVVARPWAGRPDQPVSRPVVIGQGTRLFPDHGPDQALELTASKAMANGVMVQDYRPTGRPQYGATSDTTHAWSE